MESLVVTFLPIYDCIREPGRTGLTNLFLTMSVACTMSLKSLGIQTHTFKILKSFRAIFQEGNMRVVRGSKTEL